MKIVKDKKCKICELEPKCKCKLVVIKFNGEMFTVCRKCQQKFI